jgi:hypothetical protein
MLLALLSLPTAAAEDRALLGGVELFTAFPTDVGLRGTLEGPGRVRLTSSVGLMPRPYLDAINDTATDQGWYDEDTADLIDAALKDALVLRAHLGWRPVERIGLQLEAGYGWIGLGGGLTGAEIIEAKYGFDMSYWLGDDYNFRSEASLHRVEASVGWEQVFREHLLIRFDLGGSYTFAAKAEVHRDFDGGWLFNDALDDLEDDMEDDLEETFTRSVHTPIIALGVGWRF